MYALFVLGIIPGTNFQITFQLWLDCVLLAIELACLAWLRNRQLNFRQYWPLGLLLTRQYSRGIYIRSSTLAKAIMIEQLATWQAV